MTDAIDAGLCYGAVAIIGTGLICALWAVARLIRVRRVGMSEQDVRSLLGYDVPIGTEGGAK